MTIARRAFLSLGPLAAWVLAESFLDSRLPGRAWLGGAAEAAPASRPLVQEYPPIAISAHFPVRNLSLPSSYGERLSRWTLRIEGLVRHPRVFDLEGFKAAFPEVTSINRLVCVEGWSAIAAWGGARLSDVLARVEPLPAARYVVFHAADYSRELRRPFYGSLSLEDAQHPQNLLAYQMNDHPLAIEHGAPLRLRVANQLGYKSTKFVHRIELVRSLDGIGRGRGGYWEDRGYSYRPYL